MPRQLLRLELYAFLILAGLAAYNGVYMGALIGLAFSLYLVVTLLEVCHIEIASAWANGAPWWRCLRLAITGRTGPYHYRRRIDS